MSTHELKIWPAFFASVQAGDKPFEIRKHDRDYQVGDQLQLREFVPCTQCNGTGHLQGSPYKVTRCCDVPHGRYTGLSLWRSVRAVHKDCIGVRAGYVVLTLEGGVPNG